MAFQDVTLELGGVQRTLNGRFGAWASVEEHGYHWIELLPQLSGDATALNLRVVQEVLWALLWREKPRPSLEDVGEWVGITNFGAMLAAVRLAIYDSFAVEEEQGNGRRPTTAVPGTGNELSSLPSAPVSG